MKMPLLKDRRTVGLLHRVSDDLAQLKGDISMLLGDTTKRIIPLGAREVSKIAREQLSAGQAFARSHIPSVRLPSKPPSVGIAGGVLLAGALALGYFLMKDRIALACARKRAEAEDQKANSEF